jgi:hypothetical protein
MGVQPLGQGLSVIVAHGTSREGLPNGFREVV